MPITYEEVLPWGRSFEEYQQMFALSAADLRRRLLGCGDGPAAFNAHMHSLGMPITSVDPIYVFDRDEIAARIDEVTGTILEQTANSCTVLGDRLFVIGQGGANVGIFDTMVSSADLVTWQYEPTPLGSPGSPGMPALDGSLFLSLGSGTSDRPIVRTTTAPSR